MFGSIAKMGRWLRQENEEPRRAARLTQPEIVVHYWDGSAPEGREIRDISEAGAYIYTSDHWYPGTIIRIIFQEQRLTTGNNGPGAVPLAAGAPAASACVASRVVRHGDDGVAVEFVFRDKKEKESFCKFLALIPAQPEAVSRK